MANKVYRINSAVDAKRFAIDFGKGLNKPIDNAKPYFIILGQMIDRDTTQTFRLKGARSGNPAWKDFSPKTLATRLGTPKIRYGTDKKPKRTAKQLAEYKIKYNLLFKPGPMKGYKSDRRYSKSSKLLQASGGFRNSFRVTRTTKQGLKFQTVHRLGGKIGSNPLRQVLFVTKGDLERYQKQFKIFVDKGIVF